MVELREGGEGAIREKEREWERYGAIWENEKERAELGGEQGEGEEEKDKWREREKERERYKWASGGEGRQAGRGRRSGRGSLEIF